MPFVDTGSLAVIERLPGWYGRYFHSASMTFAHYDFKPPQGIHRYQHQRRRTSKDHCAGQRTNCGALKPQKHCTASQSNKHCRAFLGVRWSR